MSTKIFDAYRLPSAVSDPLSITSSLRKVILPARLRAEAQDIYDEAIRLSDLWSLHQDMEKMPQRLSRSGGKSPLGKPDRPWLSTIHILAEEEKWEDPTSALSDWYRFEAVVLRDPADGRLLIKAFFGNHSIGEAFHSFAEEQGWEDWHYQNQTERPEGLDAKAWKERLRSWDRATGDTGKFSDFAVSIHVERMSRSARVLGVDDDEEIALTQVTPSSREERLTRILLHAVSSVRTAASEETRSVSEMLRELDMWRDQIGKHRDGSTPLWRDSLALMDDVRVEDLNTLHKGGLLTHRIDSATAERFAHALLGEIGEDTR